MKVDPYRELDVPRDASTDEIERAYRERAKATHPDAGGTREQWEATRQALVVLSNPKRRRRYDATGGMDGEPDPDNKRADALHERITRTERPDIGQRSDCEACSRQPHTKEHRMDYVQNAQIPSGNHGRFSQAQTTSPTPPTLVRALSSIDELNKRLVSLRAQAEEIAQAVGGPYPTSPANKDDESPQPSAMQRLNAGVDDAHILVATIELALGAIRRSLGA